MTDFYDNSEPFYKNRDDLLDWLADENVSVTQVAKWVVTPPSETRGPDYNSLAPAFVVRLDDLPKIFEALQSLNAEAVKRILDERSEQITLDYPNSKMILGAEQIKAIVKTACESSGKTVFEIVRDAS